MGEGGEDGEEAVDTFEGEGGDGGDVAGGEEGGLDEEEGVEGDAGVGEGEGAVGKLNWGEGVELVCEGVGEGVEEFRGWGRGGGRRCVVRGEGVNVVFETDPGYEGGAEGEVEEAFVGDGEDDEDRGEGEKNDYQAVEVVAVWLEAVEEGHGERGNCRSVSVMDQHERGAWVAY